MHYNIFENIAYCKEIVEGFRTLLLYSHIPSAAIALMLGILIYFKSQKILLGKILVAISIFFGFWAFLDITIWLGYADASLVMFAWMPIEIFAVLLFILSFYFTYAFIYKRDLGKWTRFLVFLPVLPIIIAAPTTFNLINFDTQECIAIENGLFTNYVLLIKILFSVLTLLFTIHGIAKARSWSERSRILVLASGLLLFLYSFLIAGYISDRTFDYTYEMYGLFGMVAFIGALSYLIVKFKEFNIKLLAVQMLVWALWILIASQFFFLLAPLSRVLLSITLAIAITFGVFLIRSVKREVEQREYLERISKELSSANGQLRVLDKQKNEFLSFASHDLKSPIALIKQFATLIYDGTYKEPQKVHETVLKIKNTADRAVNMVNTFLDLRKIEEGRMEYNFEKKNIVEFVSGITADFTLLAKQQKNIDVSFSSSTPDIQVTLDTNTLRQVIQNFLDNSMKYTEAGWIKVEIINEQKTALIKVSDSGLGMSKELLPILFGQFHRDPGTAKKIQGTGLGLYIAKQIVLAHHGDTWAESEGPGKGSQFYIRLPKA